jgi:hypothetical protein
MVIGNAVAIRLPFLTSFPRAVHWSEDDHIAVLGVSEVSIYSLTERSRHKSFERPFGTLVSAMTTQSCAALWRGHVVSASNTCPPPPTHTHTHPVRTR